MRLKNLSKWAISLGCAGLVLAACASSTSSSNGTTVPTGGTKTAGGVAYWAELPNSPPNMIFPFTPTGFFSVPNENQFEYLMYRPLYWFGNGLNVNVNYQLSLGQAPVYTNNDQTVTVNLNNYVWSNGEPVNAQDVVFFMNMYHSEKDNYGAYVPGINAIPDDVSDVVATSPTQVVFTLTGPVNPNWYTYNNLSQIIPMPESWDVTSLTGAPGSGGCYAGKYGAKATDTACAAVWGFLANQAGYNPSNPTAANNAFGTYVTSPIWSVVDGPWKLSHFDATGNVTMVPNTTYSGPVKPTLSEFVEVPFTSEDAEYDALLGGKLSVGYLPLADEPKATTNPLVVAAQDPRLTNYFVNEYYGWQFTYFPINFNSTGDNGAAGKIFSQLYIRQALEMLIDQPAIISKVFKGYGYPQYGPIPPEPDTYVTSLASTGVYPYNPTKAKDLLSSHGWKVVPGGTDICENAGSGSNQCGAGIPSGTPLTFNLQFATGIITQTEAVNDEIASWDSDGIHVNETTATFDTVIGNATACTPGPSCTWEMEDWAGSWVYYPDIYPTGEELFATGAVSNYGSYSDPINDANIKATDFTTQNLDNYENYLVKELPVIYLPSQVQSLTEIQKNMRGVTPQNTLSTLTPESWYFVK